VSIKGCGLPVNTRKEPPPGLRGAYWPLEGAVQLAQALGAPLLRPLDQTQVLIGRVVNSSPRLFGNRLRDGWLGPSPQAGRVFGGGAPALHSALPRLVVVVGRTSGARLLCVGGHGVGGHGVVVAWNSGACGSRLCCA
jgi:hypothetical protein